MPAPSCRASAPLALLALLALLTPSLNAAPKDALEQCIDLASDHSIVRPGGSTQFLLRTGNNHYKVALGNGCGALSIATRLAISTEGQAGRLCPTGSVVDTGRDRCDVSLVTRIEQAEFDRQQRRRR